MQMAVVLFQQVAQPADHLVRPLVVRDDIGQDLADLVEVGFLLRQESLGGLGIAQDGSERLVQFFQGCFQLLEVEQLCTRQGAQAIQSIASYDGRK